MAGLPERRTGVAIRRYAKTFLHGKAYIVHGVPALGAVGHRRLLQLHRVRGSTTNRELNAVLKQSAAVRELQDWFEAHWAEAEDYKAELLALLERFTRVYTPYEIYIKVLYEALRDQLDQDLGEKDDKPSPIALADFQHDGYLAAKRDLGELRRCSHRRFRGPGQDLPGAAASGRLRLPGAADGPHRLSGSDQRHRLAPPPAAVCHPLRAGFHGGGQPPGVPGGRLRPAVPGHRGGREPQLPQPGHQPLGEPVSGHRPGRLRTRR